MDPIRTLHRRMLMLLLLGLVATCGCTPIAYQIRPRPQIWEPVHNDVPKEKDKVVMPEYAIEPPDVLQIDGIHLVPKAPYHLRTGDTIAIEVVGTLPDAPIRGLYPIQIGGIVNLGFGYGSLAVRGMAVEEAQDAIQKHLLDHLRAPQVTVALGNIAAAQQITGPHLVAQNGKVNLGSYGTVSVVGMSVDEARKAIEDHLGETLDAPEVAVDVIGYNSKFFYVVTQGAGLGDRVLRVPTNGNETVLDAISGIGGLTENSSHRIWVARPGRNRDGRDQLLQVDWRAITQLAETETNYQLLPGDRLYISENKWIRFDNDLRMITRPSYTIGGFMNSTIGVVSRFSGNVLTGGANAQSTFAGGGVGGGGVVPVPVPVP